jgi:hypothetical protein
VCNQSLTNTWNKLKVTSFIIASIWLFCFILMSPVVVLAEIETHNTSFHGMNDTSVSFCTIEWPENKYFPSDILYVIYSILFSFLIPFFIISIFYVKILKFLKTRIEFRRTAHVFNSDEINRKVNILVLSIISVYLLCFTPFWINQIVLVTYYTVSKKPSQYFFYISSILSSIFQILISLNSALNPFLYAFISQKFREEFQRTFRLIIFKFNFQRTVDLRRRNYTTDCLVKSTLFESTCV